jgi:PAS domain S-box-containing protein
VSQSRILIVEDENIVALDIEMRLTGLGYQVVGAVATGEDAVSYALEMQPDLILMDIHLRGDIDGVEAARQIQTQRHIPVVFLTAYADDTTFQRAVVTEPFGYLLKPLDEKELQMSLEIALYRHRTEKKLREVSAENERLHKEAQLLAAELEQRVAVRTTQLAQAHDRLQLILNSVDEAVYFMDANQSILYMNPAAEQITGYTSDQALNRETILWRGTTNAAIIDQLEHAIADGCSWRGDVVNRRHDGVLYDAELRIIPVFDADGFVESFVVTQRDVSHQKELQRLKAQFVHRIGHELRTPLTNFELYLDLLARGDPGNHEKYTAVLGREAKRLGKLILGFLEMAGLDATVDPPTLEPVAVNDILAYGVAPDEHIVQAKSLKVAYQLATDLPLALANQRLLERACFHLIDNAILYAPENGRVLTTTAVHVSKNREWITITVENTGVGISLEEQGQVFDRFYRGEAAKQSVIPGAGLGLAFCKESLEKQGGFITVASEPEVNVAFTIWLKKGGA